MIKVLKKFPIILTKQKNWNPKTLAKSGAIIFLPDDAILVEPEEVKKNARN